MPYVIYEEMCDDCGLCITECPLQAIRKDGDRYVIDLETCTECGSCSDTCPKGAIRGQ
jgi:NAD-dependent dihydropyrimidine dehydrogenase PreA subunit